MRPEPIRAKLISNTTVAANGITISAGDPVTSLCKRLVKDGWDPETPLRI
jgi:hypothetical protein